jgi:hypothetical protein
MANIEYRFPILMAFATGGIPLIIQGVMGNFFFDIGTAFTDFNTFRISYIDSVSKVRYPADLFMSSG